MSLLRNSRLIVVWIVVSALAWTFPAVSASATSASADPIEIVVNFYTLLNAKQVDDAMVYVADDALFVHPLGIALGRDAIRELLRLQADSGITFEGSNFRDNDGRVTYAYVIYQNGNVWLRATDGVTIVENGKIVFDGTEATAPR